MEKYKFRLVLTLFLLDAWFNFGLSQTTTFSYTGGAQTYTVPPFVYTINVTLIGAGGGNSTPSNSGHIPGNGGRVTFTKSVNPGEVYSVYVGGRGANGVGIAGFLAPGGWNGGGNGGGGYASYNGGGGGGATDFRFGGSKLAIASGGGGAGYNYVSGDNGGNGGELTGNVGISGGGSGYPVTPTGGTQSSGGLFGAWSGWNAGTSGSLGVGGNAGTNTAGGGGGGGYYGGGGASWTGGGGGSSFASSPLTNIIHTGGVNSGNGQATIVPISSLPVTFESFTCELEDRNGLLKWSTVAEINNDFFEIKKSTDGDEWISLSTVKGQGNSTTKNEYTWLDTNLSLGISYYKLLQTDYDGAETELGVRVLNNSISEQNLEVFPNPFDDFIVLQWKEIELSDVVFRNDLGQIIDISSGIQSDENSIIIDLTNLSKGIYFIRVAGVTKKIVKL